MKDKLRKIVEQTLGVEYENRVYKPTTPMGGTMAYICNMYQRALVSQIFGNLMNQPQQPRCLFDFEYLRFGTGVNDTIGYLLKQYAVTALKLQSQGSFVVKGEIKALMNLASLLGIAVVYTQDSDGTITHTFATGSTDVLNMLANGGCLRDFDGVNRKSKTAISRCTPTDTNKSGQNVFVNAMSTPATLSPVTLTLVDDDMGGRVVFDYTNGKPKAMTDVLVVPLYFYYIIEDVLSFIFTKKNGMCRAVFSSVVKNKTMIHTLATYKDTANIWGTALPKNRDHYIAYRPEYLQGIYKPEDIAKAVKLQSRLGFRPDDLKIGFYDLDGSLVSYDMATLDPLTFLSMKPYTINDLRANNQKASVLNKYPPFVIRGVYRNYVDVILKQGTTEQQLMLCKLLNTPAELTSTNDEETMKRLRKYLVNASNYTAGGLYQLMQDNAGVFTNLQSAIEIQMSRLELAGKKAVKITLPATGKIEFMYDLLSKYICIVGYQKAGVGLTQHAFSNNKDILQCLYGLDYCAIYETKNSRLDTAKYDIENKAKNVRDLANIVYETGIDKFDRLHFPRITRDFAQSKQQLLAYIESIPTTRRASIKSDDIYFCRSLTATIGDGDNGSKDFVRSMKIERTEYVIIYK